MKLFNKKDSTATDLEVKPDTSSIDIMAKNDKPEKLKTRSLTSWLIQPILISVICFGLAYVLMELFYLKPLDTVSQNQIAKTRAQSVELQVNQYFQEQRSWLASLGFIHSLEQEETIQLLKITKPELKSIQEFPLESIDMLGAQNGLTFAGIDLLRRVAKGEKVEVDVYLQDGQWFFQIAQLIKASDLKPARVIMGVFDMSSLTQHLKKTVNILNGGIVINVEGINKAVFTQGAGLDVYKLTLPLSLKGWQVSYLPDASLFVAQDRTLLLIVLSAVLILFLVILLLVLKININVIKKDLQRVAQIAVKSMEEEGKLANTFQFGEVFSMANSIVEQSRQLIKKHKKVPNKKEVKNESAIDHIEDEPLFDDDLFDIDALDETSQTSAVSNVASQAIVEEKAQLDIEVSQDIFRAYDIRGIVNETLNASVVELLGKAIGSEALLHGQKTLCVGYDGRLSSADFAEALIKGILSTGTNAILIGQVPTPVLYFATHHFETGSGVMITGSHNPSNYNGFKMMLAGHTLSGEAIQKLYNRIRMQDFAVGQGERTQQDATRSYFDTILNDIAVAAPLKVVVDAGNGVAGGIAPELIEELGCEVIPLHCDVDGTFPNHHPDPGQPENLQDLIAAVKEHGADVGLAFDGDGDRIGVVTNSGKIIWPDRLLMLFAKDVVSRNPGADIIYDVKCSRRLNGLISSYGGRPVMWKTGHSLIKAKMKETGALLAGEMSGHVFFKERWFGFDDALYSAARLLEILGIEDKTSDDVFAAFPEDVSTPEINVKVSESSKFGIIEKLCARKEQFVGGNVSTIDGLRVDYPNGWGLCRASNTTPVLVLRFEADDEASLSEIKSKFVMHLKDIDPGLDCDF